MKLKCTHFYFEKLWSSWLILDKKNYSRLHLKEHTLHKKLLGQQLVKCHRQSNRQRSREGIPEKIPKMLCAQPDRYLS